VVLDGQEDGPAGVEGLEEKYWMRFLKGMVTDRNTTPSLEFCFHTKLTKGSEAKFISPVNESLIFCWVVIDIVQPSGMVRGWISVGLWVCSLDDVIRLCPEEAEVEGVVASSPGEISGCGFEPDLFHFGVPPIFQCFEDGLEVSFCSLPV
jgi:hypothetical protein